MKVSAKVGTGRYCLWAGSYQEMVYCIVLNSKFTRQGLSSKRFKLLKVTPFQIKPKLLGVVVNSWACQVSLIICPLIANFFNYWITEKKKKHFQNQRNTYALFKGIIRKYFTKESAEVAVHAFVTSKLDYCNALLYGLPKYRLQRLQYVQNTAARVVFQVSKFQHITPVLSELHRLPIQYRIIFKILLLVYKSLNGTSPSYLF